MFSLFSLISETKINNTLRILEDLLCQLHVYLCWGKYKCIFKIKALAILLDTLSLIHICVSLTFILQKRGDPLFSDKYQHQHNSLLYLKETEKMFNIAIKAVSLFLFSRCEGLKSPLIIFLFVKALNVLFIYANIKQMFSSEMELLYKVKACRSKNCFHEIGDNFSC